MLMPTGGVPAGTFGTSMKPAATIRMLDELLHVLAMLVLLLNGIDDPIGSQGLPCGLHSTLCHILLEEDDHS